ncbi:MAG: hypothetical protein VST70_06935 [Nitrospirota bacterium]|nr:hypothetical protein [Nitrospirota bacterium]
MDRDLDFDEGKHEYRLHGRLLPSVTHILDKMGFVDSTFFTEESRMRGVIVHKLCEMWDLDILDPLTVDPRLKGYLEAWKRFTKYTGIVFTHIEHRMASKIHGYAGTLDRVGIDGKGRKILIDIKTGAWPHIEYQLSAYRLLLDEQGERGFHESASVHLKEDGKFEIQLWEHSPEDWKAILRVYKLKERK